MRPSESVRNYTSTLRMYANFAARTVKKVCTDTPERIAGSEEEYKAQQFIAAQIGDAADEVRQEEFRLSPKAYLGWLHVSGILLIIATAVNIFNVFLAKDIPYSAFVWPVCFICLFLTALAEYRFCLPFTDGFFPKATSHNVYCIRKAAGETKRRIVFEGGADSAYERRYQYLGGKKLVAFVLIYPAIGLIYNTVVSALTLMQQHAVTLLLWISLAFLPGYLLLLGFVNYKTVGQGANFNLTGCMTGAAVLKFMGDNDIRFENTEVVVLLTGSEKTGVRGAKTAAKLHPEFHDGHIETILLSFGNIKSLDRLAVCTRDLHGSVRHNDDVSSLLKKAGELSELDLNSAKCPYGVSGAAFFAKSGVKTGLITAVEKPLPESFNTREDTADSIELRTIEKAIGLAMETAFRFDETGLE